MAHWRKRYFRFYQLVLLLHYYYQDRKKAYVNRHKGSRGCDLSRQSLSDVYPFLDPATFTHGKLWTFASSTKHKVSIGEIYNLRSCAKDIVEWKKEFPDDYKMPAFLADEWCYSFWQ